jgi:hypothetical protein
MEQQQQPTQSQPVSQEQPANSFAVPEAYAGKDWAKSIKSPDDLWKLTDNAQSLIGKRPAGIPAPDAPDEEWTKFYNAAGRPEKPDAYKFSPIEGVPEGLDLTPIQQKAANILHQAGLNQKQADKVYQLFLKEELAAADQSKAQIEEKQKALDAEYDKVVSKVFGDKYDTAAKAAQDLIVKYVPEEMRGAYEQLADSPKAMAAVIKALEGAHSEIQKLHKEYGAEGKITSGAQTTGQSIDDVRQELAKLRTSKEARDFTHPEHKKIMARIDDLSGVVKSHYSK